MLRRVTLVPALLALVTGCLLQCALCAADDPLAVRAPGFEATIAHGALTTLRYAGHDLIVPADSSGLTGILRVGKSHWVTDGAGEGRALSDSNPAQRVYRDLSDLPGSELATDYTLSEGELVIAQRATSPEAGVVGVQWGLGVIPPDYNLVVPGYGGIRIRRDSPGSSWQLDYPMAWEAQLAIVEGPGYGFCVWAEDRGGRYKSLKITKSKAGYRLGFLTYTNAPFAPKRECASVRWHVAPYTGDWRVPARRYREWAARAWALTPRARQTPAWARDIRCVIITGQDPRVLEALARRVDPRQTLLYVPSWRKFEYDRMYPDYTANDTFPAFVERAHELGYRVMVHCNYFGCDPKSPEYATFEQFQVRSPWSHEREWWLWERADPVIKFAYISPACKAWRELQIARWKELVARYRVDALHLDQTLCIYNDDNGLIDGMTMLEGNVALHRELHEALPEVALSGEGLDEVTMRYEAFAQRHAHGLDFVGQTWDRRRLQMAHPIASYLVMDSTQPYGYLGLTSPTSGQLYGAWRENYKHWGVLPTIASPTPAQIEQPEGFGAQALAEAAAFTSHRLDPDMEQPWPEELAFPYRGADGTLAAYRTEGAGTVFEVGGKEVTRIITGVSETSLPGTVAGWKCYDDRRIFSLDPTAWYPYLATPRDLAAFHVSRLPEGFTARGVAATDRMATVEVRDAGATISLTERFDTAVCSSTPFEGKRVEVTGPLSGVPEGALFLPQGTMVHAHPPWKAERKDPATGKIEANGTGTAEATFPLELPTAEGAIRFRTEVAMDKGAVGEGKTDGVLYSVTATAPGEPELHAELLNAAADLKPLELDLTSLRGKAISLRLQVHPGPKRDPTFDWARWTNPRVELQRRQRGVIGIANAPFLNALSSGGAVEYAGTPADASFTLQLPGTLILLRDPPRPVTLPLDLAQAPFLMTFVSESGGILTNPQYAGAGPAESAVGGVTRAGLSTHPPNRGTTELAYPLVLPAQPARLHGFVGLRDGSKSEGCGFSVKVNGASVAYVHKVPGEWSPIGADLAPWAGKPIVLTLVTDSEGPHSFDWGMWGAIGLE